MAITYRSVKGSALTSDEVDANFQTLVDADEALQTNIDTAQALIPSEVNSAPTIALLEDNTNWTNNIYTGPAITGQKKNDWYDNGEIDYKFTSSTTVRRIPYKYL